MVNRRGGGKSRHGCGLCKRRKIKCDEEKPFCQQCLRKNKTCPGYSVNVRFSSKHEIRLIPRRRGAIPNMPNLVDLESHTMNIPPQVIKTCRKSRPAQRDQDGLSSMLSNSPFVEHERWESEIRGEEALYSTALYNFQQVYLAGSRSPSGDGRACQLPHSLRTPELRSFLSKESSPCDPRSPLSSFINAIEWDDSCSIRFECVRAPNNPPSKSIIRQPIHGPTFLLDYWFSRICPVFSTFDSPKNPFRIYIDHMWHNSPSIFYAMQSMAAACLKTELPRAGSVSIQFRGEATRNLREELAKIDYETNPRTFQGLFLACFMLGLSSAWHDSRDLGLVYFESARGIVNKLSTIARILSDEEEKCVSFCQKGLVYWQMLTAVVNYETRHDLEQPTSYVSRGFLTHPEPTGLVLPHPFTGVADVAQEIVAKAVALTQNQKKGLSDLKMAFELEERLLGLKIPATKCIEDTLDNNSPKWHFSVVAEAYKNTGLLHLYQSFRPLVECRLQGIENGKQSVEEWLTSLAIFILNLLKQIPPSSGTRCTQPLALIIAAAALKFPKCTLDSREKAISNGSVDFVISPFESEVAGSRTFVLDRLNCFERNLPSKPIAIAIELVTEIWRQIDCGRDVCWMDVMVDHRLATIFG